MYQTHRTFVNPQMKVADLLNENPAILLMLQHFGVDFTVGELSVEKLCDSRQLPLKLFVHIANLYNGFTPSGPSDVSADEIPHIIGFLRRSHQFYKTDKYPEVIRYIRQLQEHTGHKEADLIMDFFSSYFNEVLEHLDYEDEVVFPYFSAIASHKLVPAESSFSVEEYLDHHSDIETKITDLKNLLVKHLSIEGELGLRRNLILSLLELEYDLGIHALIEENVLVPLVSSLERESAHE